MSRLAAEILVHMASDGSDAWTLTKPKRKHVLSQLVKAVNQWDLCTELLFSYESLFPLIHQAGLTQSPECQLFGLWALANLTTVQPEQYCPLFLNEGGLGLLEKIFNDTSKVHKTLNADIKR